MQMHNYEVLVSNLGVVFRTNVKAHAEHEFRSYRKFSKMSHGRASGESVTLLRDGEIVKEYDPFTKGDK